MSSISRFTAKFVSTKTQLFYCIILTLMYLNYFFDVSELFHINKTFMTIFELLIALLFCVKLLTQKYDKRSFLATVICGLLVFYITIVTGEKFLMLIYFVLFSSQGTSLKNNIRTSCIIKIFFLSFTFLLFLVSQLTSGGWESLSSFMNTRFTMGIAHPNFTFFLYFWAMVELLYLKFDNIKIRHLVIILIVLSVALLFTKSKTGLVMVVLLVMLTLPVLLRRKKLNDKLVAVAKYILPVVAATTILAVFLFGYMHNTSPEVIFLDKLFSRRLSLSWLGIQEYGIAFLPQAIDSSDIASFFAPDYSYTMPLVVDIFYVRSIISYTLLPLAGLSYLIYKKMSSRDASSRIAIIIIIFSIYALSERHGFNVCATPMFLILGDGLLSMYDKRKGY